MGSRIAKEGSDRFTAVKRSCSFKTIERKENKRGFTVTVVLMGR